MDSVPESKAGVEVQQMMPVEKLVAPRVSCWRKCSKPNLSEFYQNSDSALGDSNTIENYSPSAINVGNVMIADGNMEGAELIASAKEAFLDGMIACLLLHAL